MKDLKGVDAILNHILLLTLMNVKGHNFHLAASHSDAW